MAIGVELGFSDEWFVGEDSFEESECLPIGWPSRCEFVVRAHLCRQEMPVVRRKLTSEFVETNVALNGLPFADGVHSLVDRVVVVVLEHRDCSRVGRPEALFKLFSTVFEFSDTIDELLDGELISESIRILPFEVAVVALVLGRTALAVGSRDTHLREAVEMFFRCVRRAVRDLGDFAIGRWFRNSNEDIVDTPEGVRVLGPALAEFTHFLTGWIRIEVGHE
nr:hypothetical protein [Halococcus sp. IIIV-5B]